jgi:hypothetical protein
MNIDDRIEKCRPTKACALCVRFDLAKSDGQCEHSHCFPDCWSSYERNALVMMKQLGISDLDDVVVPALKVDDKQRHTILLFDSLIWTIDRIRDYERREAGRGQELRCVLRGLLQVAEYCGRNDGFWPDALTHDVNVAIQQWLERKLDPR